MTPAFSIERIDGTHARLSGRMGFAEAASALARSDELLKGDPRTVEVDLRGLQAVDSATLSILLAWAARANRSGVDLRLINASPELTALARLCDAQPMLGMTD